MLKPNSRRYSPANIDRTRYSIRVSHLHNGNDKDGTKRFVFCAPGKRPAKYVTIARVVDRRENEVVAIGVAICGNREVCNPIAGHGIALGRAVKDFMENYTGWDDDDGDDPEEATADQPIYGEVVQLYPKG